MRAQRTRQSCLYIFKKMIAILYLCLALLTNQGSCFTSNMAVLGRRYSSLSMISEKTVAEFKRSNEADIARGGAGGSSSLEGLRRMDDAWAKLRAGGWKAEGPQIVKQYDSTFALGPIDQYDVVVCGGTLGIFYALAMQLHGRRVAVIERGKIAGREQEWNISGKEMQIFIDLNIFT